MLLVFINHSDHALEVPLADSLKILLRHHDSRAAVEVPWTVEQALEWGKRPEIMELCSKFGVALYPGQDVDCVISYCGSPLTVYVLQDENRFADLDNLMA